MTDSRRTPPTEHWAPAPTGKPEGPSGFAPTQALDVAQLAAAHGAPPHAATAPIEGPPLSATTPMREAYTPPPAAHVTPIGQPSAFAATQAVPVGGGAPPGHATPLGHAHGPSLPAAPMSFPSPVAYTPPAHGAPPGYPYPVGGVPPYHPPPQQYFPAGPQGYRQPPPIPGHAPMARPFGEPTRDEAMMGAAAHGLSFVEGGIVGPFIVYLLKKDESDFVAFHALQSLYFGLAFLVATLLTCGLAALVLVWPYMWFEAVATLRAFEGEWYELPLVGSRALARHPRPVPPGT